MSQTTKPAKRGRHTVARHGELKSPHPLALVMKIVGVVRRGRPRLGRRRRRLRRVRHHRELHRRCGRARGPGSGSARHRRDRGRRQPLPRRHGRVRARVRRATSATAAPAPTPAGELNDVNMLVHISDAPRRVTVISFPRDLMIPIPSCTREDGSQTLGDEQAADQHGVLRRRAVVRREDRLAAQRAEHPVRGEGHLGRRHRGHQRRRRRRRVSRLGHQGPLHRHQLAGRHPQHPGHRGAAVPAHPPRRRRRLATSAASRTSSSTCRASRASS